MDVAKKSSVVTRLEQEANNDYTTRTHQAHRRFRQAKIALLGPVDLGVPLGEGRWIHYDQSRKFLHFGRVRLNPTKASTAIDLVLSRRADLRLHSLLPLPTPAR
jgi:hypothetical protein